MIARLAVAAAAALLVSTLAIGCGSNDRPYAFGGDPNQSPGTSPVGSVTASSR
jgi:hypothetical protein